MKKNIIFDLDGTLIDSAPSILESFNYAFVSLKISPSIAITSDVVGPPLMPTLTKLAGSDDPDLLKRLADAFKAHYDTEGYKKSTVYDGVKTLLEALKKMDVPVYIATNKRDIPTQKIITYLNWAGCFNGVFALDTYSPAVASKALMIERILVDFNIKSDEAVYIGDRYEDGLAADYNHMPFIMASWGYADQASNQLKPNWRMSKDVDALMRLLLG
jgi:phosphoglycolate phosphatase